MSHQTPDPQAQAEATLGLALSFAPGQLSPAAEARVWRKMQTRLERVSSPILWATAASVAVLIVLNVFALNQSRKTPDTGLQLLAATYETGDFTLYNQP